MNFSQKTVLGSILAALLLAIIALVLALQTPFKINALDTKLRSLKSEVDTAKKYIPPFIYAGEPVGYVIEFENGARFYFASDTGLIGDFKVIGDFYHPDVAFIPIGNIYTMDYKAGAYATSLINPAKYVVPNHYASYPMLESDPGRFFSEIKKYSVRAAPLKFVEGQEQTVLGVKALWLGHGTWRFISPKGVEIFIDPQFTYNPKFPEAWKDMTKFSNTALVLMTHGHFDHCTVPDIQLLAQNSKPFMIAPFELGIWLKDYLTMPIIPVNKGASLGKDEAKGMGVQEDMSARLGDIRVYVTPAEHSSGATPVGEKARY